MSENNVLNKSVINWYPGHMAKTKRLIKENLNLIDIVYEVIDARIPYSSKLKDIDEYLKGKPKILIMTKFDLCDVEETKKWQQYYNHQGYQVITLNLESNVNLKPLLQLTQELMVDENNKREQKGFQKRKTRVLIVGIPNVGKSTLINRLVGKKVSNVGNRPGITKQLNWIRIGQDLELLDSPGILWPKLEGENIAYNLAALTAIKEDILPLDEVVFYIIKTLSRYYPDKLKERYGIDSFNEDNYEEALEVIGRKRGCLVQGGLVDYDKVYTIVLNDVKNGLINGITFDRYNNV